MYARFMNYKSYIYFKNRRVLQVMHDVFTELVITNISFNNFIRVNLCIVNN